MVVRDGKLVKQTDIVREAILLEDWKKALKIAKDFRLNVSKEQRSVMTRAYECIVHPEFYQQLGIDLSKAISQGKDVLNSLYGS